MKYVLDASVAVKWVMPEPDSAKALALQDDANSGIGVYDCLYVALAEREQCQVASADQRLVNTFPAVVVPLSSLP